MYCVTKTRFTMSRYPCVLSIAGSDSSGGAGIQADIKTISALGCYAATAITATTAQNTLGVQAIHTIPPVHIEAQLEAILDDLTVDAIKIGMLPDQPTIQVVAEILTRYQAAVRHIVLDPVMVATSGDRLTTDDTVKVLVASLFPLTTILTPNLPEAEILLGRPIHTYNDRQQATQDLLTLGVEATFLKGGHLEENLLTDLFIQRNQDTVLELNAPKIPTANTHGTGCTLSSAMASFLARGFSLEESVRRAHLYTHFAIEAGKSIQTGKGSGPVNHFFSPNPLLSISTDEDHRSD